MPVDIDKMTSYELVALNHRIVERLKFLDYLQDIGQVRNISNLYHISICERRNRSVQLSRGIVLIYPYQ